MLFKVDNTLLWDNCFYIITDEGNVYCVKLDETAIGTNIWILNFILVDGVPNNKEVFKTIQTMQENLKKLLIEKNINTVIAYIDGATRKERDKKTKIFTRWIDDPFECFVDESPEIRIQGGKNPIYPDTNFIKIVRKNYTDIKPTEVIKETPTETSEKINIKFCYNCGTENKNYKFCPGCGKNLQQS